MHASGQTRTNAPRCDTRAGWALAMTPTMSEGEEWKSCQRCGRNNYRIYTVMTRPTASGWADRYRYICDDCPMPTDAVWYDTTDAARAAWNRRSTAGERES